MPEQFVGSEGALEIFFRRNQRLRGKRAQIVSILPETEKKELARASTDSLATEILRKWCSGSKKSSWDACQIQS